jgi:hypothetical protein
MAAINGANDGERVTCAAASFGAQSNLRVVAQIVAPSRRPDGSLRKARPVLHQLFSATLTRLSLPQEVRIRAGYLAPEEVARYRAPACGGERGSLARGAARQCNASRVPLPCAPPPAAPPRPMGAAGGSTWRTRGRGEGRGGGACREAATAAADDLVARMAGVVLASQPPADATAPRRAAVDEPAAVGRSAAVVPKASLPVPRRSGGRETTKPPEVPKASFQPLVPVAEGGKSGCLS